MMTSMYKKTSTPNRPADPGQISSNDIFVIDRTGETHVQSSVNRTSNLLNFSKIQTEILTEKNQTATNNSADVVIVDDDDDLVLCDDVMDIALESSRASSVMNENVQESDQQSLASSFVNDKSKNKRPLKVILHYFVLLYCCMMCSMLVINLKLIFLMP